MRLAALSMLAGPTCQRNWLLQMDETLQDPAKLRPTSRTTHWMQLA
jgi:hypothetical protein